MRKKKEQYTSDIDNYELNVSSNWKEKNLRMANDIYKELTSHPRGFETFCKMNRIKEQTILMAKESKVSKVVYYRLKTFYYNNKTAFEKLQERGYEVEFFERDKNRLDQELRVRVETSVDERETRFFYVDFSKLNGIKKIKAVKYFNNVRGQTLIADFVQVPIAMEGDLFKLIVAVAKEKGYSL